MRDKPRDRRNPGDRGGGGRAEESRERCRGTSGYRARGNPGDEGPGGGGGWRGWGCWAGSDVPGGSPGAGPRRGRCRQLAGPGAPGSGSGSGSARRRRCDRARLGGARAGRRTDPRAPWSGRAAEGRAHRCPTFRTGTNRHPEGRDFLSCSSSPAPRGAGHPRRLTGSRSTQSAV